MTHAIQRAILCTTASLLCGVSHAQATDVDCEKCIDTADIAGEAVTTYKLRKQSVTTSRLAKEAVSTTKIRDGAVTENKLSPAVATRLAAATNPVVNDGLGNEIGQLISIGENGWSIEVITAKGYLLTLSPQDGELSNGTVYFASSDCTGTGYIDISTFSGRVTQVFDVGGSASLQYVGKDSLPVADFAYQSLLYDESGCYTQSAIQAVWPLLPNDPDVTGVVSDSFPLPIRIDLPE